MKEYPYTSYKRIHKYAYASDIEKGKITRETFKYEKYQKKVDQMVKKLTPELVNDAIEDIAEETLMYEYASQQQMKSAKGHKSRLKILQKHEDFD
jgi:hypothetical protein